MGVSYETFWHLTPKKLEYFLKAYKTKIKMQDEQMWIMGMYIQSAVGTAVEHCLAGRKAKSEYIDKPILKDIEERNKPLTEEEIQRQRDLFVAKMQSMKATFDANHQD